MTNTIIAKQRIRRGNLQDMPVLSPGEFGLATDEQRLFLGQEPIRGTLYESQTDATSAVLDFSTKTNGVSTLLDLDGVNEFVIRINNQFDIPSTNVSVDDTKFTVQHGLGVTPTAADVFELLYNKEVTSYRAESSDLLQSTLLEKTLAYGTPESTGIDFLSAVKNSITFDYYLTTPTAMRKGQLDISIRDTSSTITDNYNSDSDDLDVEFSIENTATGEFVLNFDTSYTGQIQMDFMQKSFARTTSA